MFDSTKQDLFNNVTSQFGSKINLKEGGNSYLFFSLLAKEVDLANQYGVEQLNKFSVFSSINNNLNGIGFLLNNRRPYAQFSFLGSISAPASTNLNPGLQVGYVNSLGQTLLFITQEQITIPASGSYSAEFFYTGVDQALESISSGTSFVLYPDSGGDDGDAVTNVSSTEDVDPSFVSDPEYRNGLETIYQSSSSGIDGAIELSVSNLNVVSSCKVYIGTNKSAPTSVQGKSDIYDLDYGQFLIVVKWSDPSVPDISPPFYPAVDLVIAKTILKKFNYLNFFYDSLASRKREIPLSTSAGNTINVVYYEANKTQLDIVLNISPETPRANDSIKQSLENDLSSYIDGIPIGGNFYFSEVSRMADKYNLISVSMSVNLIEDILKLNAKADEYYSLGTFSLSYVG